MPRNFASVGNPLKRRCGELDCYGIHPRKNPTTGNHSRRFPTTRYSASLNWLCRHRSRILNRPSAKAVDCDPGSCVGLLTRYARVPVSGAATDIDIFMRGRGIGVGSDCNAGPTVMMAHHVSYADVLEPAV